MLTRSGFENGGSVATLTGAAGMPAVYAAAALASNRGRSRSATSAGACLVLMLDHIEVNTQILRA
jgi:hypothetical protein